MSDYLDLKLGYSCNNNCIHCIMQNLRFSKDIIKKDFTTEECEKEIRNCAIQGYKKICFTGGEPTIRKDFIRLMRFAQDTGLQTILQTNGRALSYRSLSNQLKEVDVIFGIAIHGPNKEVHDRITRAENSFEQTVAGIKNAIAIGKTVMTKTVISKHNYKHLPQLVNLLLDLKVHSINISFPREPDNCPGFTENIIPRYSQVSPYIKQSCEIIREHRRKGNKIDFLCTSIPHCLMGGCDDAYYDPAQEKNIQITRFIGGWDEAIRHRVEMRDKPETCNLCSYENVCCGVRKDYLSTYGADEFKPIRDVMPLVKGLKKGPFEIKLELTEQCNCNCSFCQNKNTFAKESRKKDTLSTQDVKKIIDQMHNQGLQHIRLTGGEPSLRIDLPEIIRNAHEKGISIILNTNTVGLTPDRADLFMKHIDTLLIPIHGYDSETDKQITGRDNFQNKTELIRYIKRKYPARVCINTIGLKQNIEHIEQFAELMISLGVDEWFLAFPTPTTKDDVVDPVDVAKAAETLLRYNKERGTNFNIGQCSTIPFCAYDPIKILKLQQNKCSGGMNCGPNNSIVIGPDGTARPCYSIDTNLGNIRENSLKEILSHPSIEQAREKKNLPNECYGCILAETCRGGCRFVPLLHTCDIAGKHPLANPDPHKDILFRQKDL